MGSCLAISLFLFPSIFLIKIGIHPIFSMVYLPTLRVLSLERLSIVITKALTIRLRNSSNPIGFPLKVTELLTWYTFPIYLI